MMTVPCSKFHLKIILTLAIFLLAGVSKISSQNRKHSKPGLYYFKNKAGKIGVENEKGTVIIPAEFSEIGNHITNKLIEGPLIEFFGARKGFNNPKSPVIPGAEVFDRRGRFLYYVQWFDNGPDYYSEGLRRINKNGKIGFANAEGDIVIEPKYDWTHPFNYGYTRLL